MSKQTTRMSLLALVSALALAVAIPALAATEEITRSTGDISKVISDEDAVSQKLVVDKVGKVKDVNVVVAADHNQNSDLTFVLESPGGRLVHLSSGNGASGNGYGSSGTPGCGSTMTFDDEATEDVTDYEGVDHLFSGKYKPESFFEDNPADGLAKLNGVQMKGTWKLIAMDTEEFGGGQLQCFKLKITYQTG